MAANARENPADATCVAAQLGRAPRRPWRVASRCSYGYPNAIVSPACLEDGTPFPNLAWLTCPWLLERVAALESAGGTAEWTRRAQDDPAIAAALRDADAIVRQRRAVESGGEDAFTDVGLAGQRDPLKVKCLHAHVALGLLGIEDPIGREVLAATGDVCPDRRCERLVVLTRSPEGGTEDGQ